MAYRLGLDLGTNSIGWCLLNLNQQHEPDRLLRLGARIFPAGRKPKDATSLAEDRRTDRIPRRCNGEFHLNAGFCGYTGRGGGDCPGGDVDSE